MVAIGDIKELLRGIPPLPDTLKDVLAAINRDDLVQAAQITQKDPMLTSYLQKIVNKPYFGFTQEVKNISQVYGALGVLKAKQLLNAYMVTIIMPRSWIVFDLSSERFQELQLLCMEEWERILQTLKIEDREIAMLSTILPATVIVCEKLFSEHEYELAILKEHRFITTDEILFNLTGRGFFDIAGDIARFWGLSSETINIFESVTKDDTRKIVGAKELELAKYLHLLFFHISSLPQFVESKMSDVIAIDIDFIEDIKGEFYKIFGIAA